MSLDISLVRKLYDINGIFVDEQEVFEYNITHNLTKMAEEIGMYKVIWRPEEMGLEQGEQLIGMLSIAVRDMERRKLELEQFNPANAWGSFDCLANLVEKYLIACLKHPQAYIRISR